MIHAMKLCVLLTLISFSFIGCNSKTPEAPKMDTCHVPYTAPADINNTSCSNDAAFYTCVKIRTLKNFEAKKNEAAQREINEGVCK